MVFEFLFSSSREDLENSNDRNQAVASSLATVLQKNFNVKGPLATSLIERCPTFVAKEKSIKPKFLSKNKKVRFRISILSSTFGLADSHRLYCILYLPPVFL